MKVLVGSPVHQKPKILLEFLKGLEELDKGEITTDFIFIDDNTESESTELLNKFLAKNNGILIHSREIVNQKVVYNSHCWDESNLSRVALFKNEIIKMAIYKKYDYLFLIDSDIVLDKRALIQLMSDQKEIVSNVFWNQWVKNGIATPQCFWIPDIYDQFEKFSTKLSFEKADAIRNEMIERLKQPGLYEVDGLGACTLIKREVLENGVDFTKIHNLKIPGEDRDFCIRAGVQGYKLYMDTYYPAYHISKEEFLDRVEEFKRDGYKIDDMCLLMEKNDCKERRFKKLRHLLVRVGKKMVREFED